MKSRIIILTLLIAILLIIPACKNGGTDIQSSNTDTQSTSSFGSEGSIQIEDPTLEQMLIFAIQDEFFARREYDYIINELGAKNPFTNIIKAEEQHISALKPLFDKYEITLPQDNSSEYIIYPETITEALETCVNAEINNIAMYEKFLSKELPDEVRTVFESLMNASKNHLDAFNRNLNK